MSAGKGQEPTHTVHLRGKPLSGWWGKTVTQAEMACTVSLGISCLEGPVWSESGTWLSADWGWHRENQESTSLRATLKEARLLHWFGPYHSEERGDPSAGEGLEQRRLGSVSPWCWGHLYLSPK